MQKEEKENLVERFIRFAVRCLVLGVWSIIGLIVWIPLLLRVVSIYSFSIIPLTLSGNKAALKRVSQALQAATTFYVNGFKLALSALSADKPDEFNDETNEPSLSLDSTLKELLISLAFWGLAFFSIGLIPIAIICGVTFLLVILLKVYLTPAPKPSKSPQTPIQSPAGTIESPQGPNKSKQIPMG